MQNCQRHASWQSIASVDVGRLAQDELSVMHRGACLYRASTQADACARGRVQNCGGTGRPFAIGRLNDITMETLQSPAVANSASPAAMNSTPAENVLPSAPSDDAAVQIVSLYQAQKKIYPRAVTGVFIAWRWAFVWLTQLVFYGTPWLVWNGRQAVLFDLGTRRFYVFGLVLYPQDFIYMTALLLISAYSLFLFTTVAGRLWCGYACPQTVYTELFMWVERKLEGDRAARMKRDANRWRFDTLWRKSAKHGAWIAMGLWTGFTLRRLLHAHPHARRGSGKPGPWSLGDLLGPLLRFRDLRQCRLHARAGLQVHVPLRALPERDARQGHAHHHLR